MESKKYKQQEYTTTNKAIKINNQTMIIFLGHNQGQRFLINQNKVIIQSFSKRSVANLGFIECGGLLSFKYKGKK